MHRPRSLNNAMAPSHLAVGNLAGRSYKTCALYMERMLERNIGADVGAESRTP